jgi:serine/threonine protein kinase
MILDQRGDQAILLGIPIPLTVTSLVEMLERDDGVNREPGSPSFDPQLVESGGEAWVRLHNSTVLRFERKLLSGERAPERQARFLAKMQLIQKVLPAGAVPPLLPLFLKDDAGVIGHTLEYVEKFQSFEAAAPTWNATDATNALRWLHKFIAECHERGIVLGEVNPSNFGFGTNGFAAIDTMSFGLSDFPCVTAYRSTVDPIVLRQDEEISDSSPEAMVRDLPYSVESDWYGFACIVLEVLLGVGPWGGRHRLAGQTPTLRRERIRALRGLSIFDPKVTVVEDDLRRRPEALSEPLYNHLYGIFNRGERGVFPSSLLKMRWTRCSSCSSEYSSCACPCAGARNVTFAPKNGGKVGEAWRKVHVGH